MGGKEEIELAIKLAITTLDLKYTEQRNKDMIIMTEEVAELKNEIVQIPEIVSRKITECQRRQERRRRWNVGTGISIGALIVSIGTLVIVAWPV